MSEEIENWIMKLLELYHDSSEIISILMKKGYTHDEIEASFNILIQGKKIKERVYTNNGYEYEGELGYYDKV